MLADKQRFAGYHRLVHTAFSFAYHSVHRHFLALTHLHDVALCHGSEGHVTHFAHADDMRLLRHESHKRAYGRSRGFLRTLLKTTTRQHKGNDHYRCIVISVPLYATRSPELFAPKSIEDAEEERDGCGHRHKRVHIG